jgi:hypothetical protein
MAPPLRLAALLLVVFVAVAASSAVRADLVISRADRKVSGLPHSPHPVLQISAPRCSVLGSDGVCVDVLSSLCRLI